MAIGLGVSIGTVNTVSALAGAAAPASGRRRHVRRDPAVTRRTTLTFDSTGAARVGLIPRHGRAVSEFADLGRRGTVTARVGNRSLSSADLVALVTDRVIGEVRRERGIEETAVALTHPAGYTADHLGSLRAALDGLGLDEVALVAEPVAAATWFEVEHGPLTPGLALVYDLGGACLDVALVRVGTEEPSPPIVGRPVRSERYGGRAFGALVARDGAVRATEELRAEHVKASLEVVYRCLTTADVTMADVDRVLVVGGAARPGEVARVLGEELARPVVIAADPERTVADGAALLARRAAQVAPDADAGRFRRGLWRAAAVACMSAIGVGIAVGVPADAVIAGVW
ncbi:Hsp70 family protein [Nocardia takedensis]